MRTLLPAALALAALLVPAAARPEPLRIAAGARLGWAAAAGDAAKGLPVREFALASQVPLQLDATLRAWRALDAGAYLSYGIGGVDRRAIFGLCGGAGADCSGRAWRAGVQARWSFPALRDRLVPWAGVALGWQWASVDLEGPLGASRLSANGLEAGVQGGAAWRVTPRLSAGPYLSLSVGRYRSGEVVVGGSASSRGDVVDKAFHEWLGAGVAGRFEL